MVVPTGIDHVYETAPVTGEMEYPFAVVEIGPGVPNTGVVAKFHPVLFPILVEP